MQLFFAYDLIHKLRECVERIERMENLLQPLGRLKSRIEKSILNKRKQLTLDQFFINIM